MHTFSFGLLMTILRVVHSQCLSLIRPLLFLDTHSVSRGPPLISLFFIYAYLLIFMQFKHIYPLLSNLSIQVYPDMVLIRDHPFMISMLFSMRAIPAEGLI